MAGRPFSELEPELQKLVEAATKVKANAHCPYSHFHVGSAVLTRDGTIFAGCNVENASYGLTVCAERVAIMSAVSEGHKEFRAIAICCDVKNDFKGSCGACRQVFAEFGLDWDVILTKPDRSWRRVSVGDMLPFPFCPSVLEEERV